MIRSVAVVVLAFLVRPAVAQPVNLTEKVRVGDRAKFTLDLDVGGELIFVQEEKKEELPLQAKARHVFAERVLAVADGMVQASARHYTEATASAVVGAERSSRELSSERRLVVARWNPDGVLCFAAAGPLTRDELDLVAEHFNPQCLAGLLPGKIVTVGDTWTVAPVAAHAACLFDALIQSKLTGKLTEVKDGIATFSIDGRAEGVEAGAKAVVTVSATGTFDIAAGRITALKWKQKDEREGGPVSPASKVEATITLKRERLAEVPKELTDDAIAKLPRGDLPPTMTALRYTDPQGRYSIVHSRDWHITGQTDTHLVMRLVDRGEFVAQATLNVWRKVDPGKHATAEEFKKAVAEVPGWKSGRVLAEGELPAGGGMWLYRVCAEGKMESQPAVQTFYLLAGPHGDQIAVTVLVPPDKFKALGTRDATLIRAIEFGKK